MKPISALALATLLVSGCGRKPETQATSHPDLAAVQVQVQTAESKQRATTEEVLGTVRAKLRATLEAKLSGRIDKMPVLLGQGVKTGQLVAHLDAAEIKARLEQAQASLQQAERDWKRSSALFGQQAATRSDYDTADSRYQVAKAAVAEAQAMMGYIEVLAPFDGVVTKKWADVGDFATPGKPLIDIEDPFRLQLEADVPEAIASLIKQDAPLAVRVDSVKSDLTATVSEIAPSADPASRTFRVKLDLPQTPGLRSGQFARLVVPVGENTSVRVPASAVVVRGQMEILFVVANQRAQLHLVKTGKRLGDDVEILAGLDPGQVVVVSGAALLVDGQPVEAR
jgi:RND family efflux transporter MFP subunit